MFQMAHGVGTRKLENETKLFLIKLIMISFTLLYIVDGMELLVVLFFFFFFF